MMICRVERLFGTLQCRKLSGGLSGRPGLVKTHSQGRSMLLLLFLSVLLLLLLLLLVFLLLGSVMTNSLRRIFIIDRWNE